MKVTFFGTRGSVPVSNKNTVKTGGNTTCLQLESDCFPTNMLFAIDGGSGIVPLAFKALGMGVTDIHVVFTHYHWDHIQGIPMMPETYIKAFQFHLWGPKADGKGAQAMMKHMMVNPHHPVDFKDVESHFYFHDFENPTTRVVLVHPEGGMKSVPLAQFEVHEKEDRPIPIGEGKYSLKECMVIKMYISNHPERTISYRFEERPTGKVFCFLTDHENQDGIPVALRHHLAKADLLVMDCQYSREKYDNPNFGTAGYGHGTPDYCVKVAQAVQAKNLGLTHHDPMASDNDVEKIVESAHVQLALTGKKAPALKIFPCRDYESIAL